MRSFLPALLLLCTTVAAAAAPCPERLDRDEFRARLSTAAEPVRVVWPEGTFPLGHTMQVAFRHGPGDDLRYRAWVARPGSTSAPKELEIGEVARDTSGGETSVQLDLDLGAHAPRRTELVVPMSFVVMACDPGTGELRFVATGEHLVSTELAGWLALLFAIVVAYLALAAFAGLWPLRFGGDYPRPRHGLKSFFLDFRGRVSLSYVQIFFFFGVIYLAFAYVFGRTFQLSELSADVLYLLGISAAGGVAGKIANIQKNRLKWEN